MFKAVFSTSFHKHATRNELARGELGVHWTICVYCCFSFLFRRLSTLHLRIAFLFHDVFLVSLFVFISSVLINQIGFCFIFFQYLCLSQISLLL